MSKYLSLLVCSYIALASTSLNAATYYYDSRTNTYSEQPTGQHTQPVTLNIIKTADLKSPAKDAPKKETDKPAVDKDKTAQEHTALKPSIDSKSSVEKLTEKKPAKTEFKLTSFEKDVIANTNAQRAQYGMPPLVVDESLMSTARAHGSWMAGSYSMSHGSYGVAENIAMGQWSPGDVLNTWMNSSGHRANILGGYRRIGVSAFRASNGTIFWCQQFR